MKKMKRTLIAAIFMVLCISFNSFAAEGMVPVRYEKDEIYYRYVIDHEYKVEDRWFTEQEFVKNQWKYVWEDWFYFGDDGITKHNTWFEVDGKWYYFDNWSRMLHDTTTPDGYTVGTDGAWVKDGQVVVEAVANN